MKKGNKKSEAPSKDGKERRYRTSPNDDTSTPNSPSTGSDAIKKPAKLEISFLLNKTRGESHTTHASPADTQTLIHSAPGIHHNPTSREQRRSVNKSTSQLYSGLTGSSSSERKRQCNQCDKVFAQTADLKKQYVFVRINFLHFKIMYLQCRTHLTSNLTFIFMTSCGERQH